MHFLSESKEVDQLESKISYLEHSLADEEKAFKLSIRQLERAVEAQKILQTVAQVVQQQAHEQISKVVSSCLQSVFGDEAYEFRIRFEKLRGKTEAKLLFCKDGLEVDPTTASGGGMIDVAAFALQVICIVLHRPRLRMLFVSDEPFKFVSADYRTGVRVMLERLAHDLNIQMIIVTHIDDLKVGKIIEIK